MDTLFIALETKSYIPPVLGTESVVPENAQNLEFAQEVQKSPHVGYSIDGPVGRPEVHIKRSESVSYLISCLFFFLRKHTVLK